MACRMSGGVVRGATRIDDGSGATLARVVINARREVANEVVGLWHGRRQEATKAVQREQAVGARPGEAKGNRGEDVPQGMHLSTVKADLPKEERGLWKRLSEFGKSFKFNRNLKANPNFEFFFGLFQNPSDRQCPDNGELRCGRGFVGERRYEKILSTTIGELGFRWAAASVRDSDQIESTKQPSGLDPHFMSPLEACQICRPTNF